MRRRLQFIAAGVLVGVFAGMSHYCNAGGGPGGLGALLALSPLAAMVLILIWRRTARVRAAALTAGLAALLLAFWPVLQQHASLIALLEEAGLYGVLAVTFGRSLLPGGEAVCTRLADRLHGPLSSREVSYTRQVTVAWAVFFCAVTAAAILLYLRAPVRIWSIYINFCVLPLVGAMFVGEYVVRRWALPRRRRGGLAAAMRVYFAASE